MRKQKLWEKNNSFSENYLWFWTFWYIWLFGLKLKIRLKNETEKPISQHPKKAKKLFKICWNLKPSCLTWTKFGSLFRLKPFCKLIKYWSGSRFNASRFRLESHAMKFIFCEEIFYVTLNSQNLLAAIIKNHYVTQ